MKASWPRRMAFSAMMTETVSHPAMRVRGAERKECITSTRLVRIKSGMSAKGSAKLRTTCDRTRILSGSRPVAMTAMAGMTVMRRRRKMGNLISRKPSMMTCQAMTPTVEDERPEQSSATAKTMAAERPKSGPRVR